MIDINYDVWLTEFYAKAAAAKEKDAFNARRSEMRRCSNGHEYLFPDVIHPDAGGIFDAGIVGKHRIEPMAVCPECRVRV